MTTARRPTRSVAPHDRQSGLVLSSASLGINFLSAELVAKRLELVRDLVPAATRVAVLVNPTGPNSETTLRDARSAAHAIGLEIQVLNASTSRQINAAFATFVRERPDALFVDIDPTSPAGVCNWST